MPLLKSVANAWKGVVRVAREEHNFRLELLAAVVVCVAMIMFDLSVVERALLILMIAAVLVLELVNSVVERIIDILKPRIHHYVQDIKDITAGAVLVTAVAAVLVGMLIFWPHVATMMG